MSDDGLHFDGGDDYVDADTANIEQQAPGDTISCMQGALAELCFKHEAGSFLQPKMLKVFLETILPAHCLPGLRPSNTRLGLLVTKRFSVKDLTGREALGNTLPSKHVTGFGTRYRHLKVTPPDQKYDTEHSFTAAADEQRRQHYKFLKATLANHPLAVVRGLRWQQTDLLQWFEKSAEKKKSDKAKNSASSGKVLFPALSYKLVEYESLTVIINDVFCDEVAAKFNNPMEVVIFGIHI